MKLDDLREALARFPYQGSTVYVNCEDVVAVGTDAALVIEDDGELDEANERIMELEKENEELEKERFAAIQGCDAAEELLAELKDPESGVTVAKLVFDTKAAIERADVWRKAHFDMTAELDAIRKRKGVAPHYFDSHKQIMSLLYDLKHRLQNGDVPMLIRMKSDADALLAKCGGLL